MPFVMDVFSLELAIYFVLPPLLLFVAAYSSADIFVLVAKVLVKRDIRRDTGVTWMSILILATATVVFMTYWLMQRSSSAIIAGVASYFVVGGFSYARLVQEFGEHGTKHRFAPIGFKKGFLLSAILSAVTAVPAAIVAWCVYV